MCYMILAGRNATEGGHTLCAHNNDLQGHHAALFEILPARRYSDNKAKYYKRQGDSTELCSNPILFKAIVNE